MNGTELVMLNGTQLRFHENELANAEQVIALGGMIDGMKLCM